MPTLPKNWKITSHPKSYAPSSAAQEMLTRLIPLPPPVSSATVPAADYRGRLLLNMINSLEFIITNGRFPVPPPTLRPYTFFWRPNTHSVLGYNLIAKHLV